MPTVRKNHPEPANAPTRPARADFKPLTEQRMITRIPGSGCSPTGARAVFDDPVVATALLDRLLHNAVVDQIEGSSYRMRQHADLIPEHVRSSSPLHPPPAPKRRGRPPTKATTDQSYG